MRPRFRCRRENISAEEALFVLKKDDEERRKWGIKVYGVDTQDSKLYDMVLNISTMTVDDAVDILCTAIGKKAFQTTPESQKRLEDLALAARVSAAVTSAPSRHSNVKSRPKQSKIARWCCCGMPGPVSQTWISAQSQRLRQLTSTPPRCV